MKTITHWIVSALAIGVAAYLLPGVYVDGIVAALVLAVVLGAINAFLRPVLILLTLPLNIFTLGLFTFVLNAVLVLLAAAIVPGFSVASFWYALLFSLVLSIVNAVFKLFEKKD
ncbi:MAG: rane protein of unknown function [Parcubacteria group bacterium]|nr:rane protein of unknown function [Parcubacteria group bacterium]